MAAMFNHSKVSSEELASLVAYSDSSEEEENDELAAEEARRYRKSHSDHDNSSSRVCEAPASPEEKHVQEEEETRRRKLHLVFKENFSHDTIEEAIRMCGVFAADEELLDFMLALPYRAASPPQQPAHSVENGSNEGNGNKDKSLEARKAEEMEWLEEMGFTSEQVSAAFESCGAEASVESKVGFIESMDPEELDEVPVLDQLIEFGYPKTEVLKAMEACDDCDDLDVLVDYLEAHTDSQDHHVNSQLESEEDENEFMHDDMDNSDCPSEDDCPNDPISDEEEEENDERLHDLIDEHTPINAVRNDFSRVMRNSKPLKKKRRRHGRFKLPKLTKKEPAGRNWGKPTGFSLPGQPVIPRSLTLVQQRKPFFYFENVMSMTRGSWTTISENLYNIQAEFVCASHFSVTRRPRGYVHNLPLHGRKRVPPLAPMTIREFLPETAKFIPKWDTRITFNTITRSSGIREAKKVREFLKRNPNPNEEQVKVIMAIIKRYNLVWTDYLFCTPLEPHERERALGFVSTHCRGLNHTVRLKSLGNSFQTDVVAYHLSPLKELFPDGVRVLSLFSGIGGAEVALQRAGVAIKFLVSVEKEEDNRVVLEKWWKSSGQKGVHDMSVTDVNDLTTTKLRQLMTKGGGPFGLVIGGSPCNNLSGCNRFSRTGLDGGESREFFQFPLILERLRSLA